MRPGPDPCNKVERDHKPTLRAAVLDGEQRQLAMSRFGVLRPHLEEESAACCGHQGSKLGLPARLVAPLG